MICFRDFPKTLLPVILAATCILSAQKEETNGAKESFLPRFLTKAEQNTVRANPITAPRGAPVTPTGPIYCPAEYEPMDGILMTYQGPQGWLTILDQMAAAITTTGNADVYVMADNNTEAAQIRSNMVAAGAVESRVQTLVVTMDSIWMRDYGPRYIFEGDVRAIIDHTYNRPRPNDNNQPTAFAALKNHQRYVIPLVHGGGNYHLNATGDAHTTRLINNENPGLTETEIGNLWNDFQNLQTSFYEPFPLAVDATQHIDMWMQAIADDEVIISDWPFDVGSTQDQICDSTAADLISRGYTVHRIPARSVGGTHYTFTNVVMCNDLVLLPMYTNGTASQHNNEALQVWQNALPDKTITQVNCQAIVTAAGVMHCIVMHLPAPRGGQNPTTYLKTRYEGNMFMPGDMQTINWISDDNIGVTEVDLLLSTNGGQSFDVTIAQGIADDGSFNWTVPDINTTTGRLRVVVRDADSNTGMDSSSANFTINGSDPCPWDCFPDNGDGTVGDGVINNSDYLEVLVGWLSGAGACDMAPDNGNDNYGDGRVNMLDLVTVINRQGSCP